MAFLATGFLFWPWLPIQFQPTRPLLENSDDHHNPLVWKPRRLCPKWTISYQCEGFELGYRPYQFSYDSLLKWWFMELEGATWCVCKDGLGDSALQKTLDSACGAGADCGPVHQNGGCFLPNTVKAHCSFAANSYFQRKGQAQGSCDFSGSAMVTTIDPSISGCVYPSSASPVNSGTIPVTGTPTTTTNPGTTNSPNTPFGSTTPTSVVGGMNNDSGSRLELTLAANVLAFLFTLMLFRHMV